MFVTFCVLVLLIWLGLYLHTRKQRRLQGRPAKPICRKDLRDLRNDIRLWQLGHRPPISETEED